MDKGVPEQKSEQIYGPWNPGLRSPVPPNIRHLSTLLSFDNVSTPLDQADELATFSGLNVNQIVKLRPERLAVHETLIRVTANISVPDGSRYEDLGINFRKIVATIMDNYIGPKMFEIITAYDDLDHRTLSRIRDELSENIFAPLELQSEPDSKGFFSRLLFGDKKTETPALYIDPAVKETQIIEQWRQKMAAAKDAESAAMYRALINTANSIRGVHGQIRGGIDLIASLVNTQFCNTYGSQIIGELIEPIIIEAANKEGFRLLPIQEKPIIMNTKGASASGKSTLRPLQKKLTKEFGEDWTDFALISPDIWRKYLLDYDSLGAFYKYAGSLTGDENAIIDQKLDLYMAKKADEGRMSHLLIDRFRFDSFTPVADEMAGSTLLTRFGDEVYMFFLITPPEETVERSWKRGEEVGRYKSVDDLLHHNVEAYTGMPLLFFTWALKTDKSVHYEFLDNDVQLGTRPKTIAFGQNGKMTILDVKKTLDIERYRKININGTTPSEVYPDPEKMRADKNVGFLQECAKLLPSITFADQASGKIYGKMESSEITWTNGELLAQIIKDEDTKIALEILTGSPPETNARESLTLDRSNALTLGQWGEAGF